jgi:2-keto-4-pentenoate hydratase/2-oxohepta-3-ene-1,7-dioic acid hydratase in catechol pathway
MKIAAYTYQNQNFVGLVSIDGQSVEAYAFAPEQAKRGLLAVIDCQQAAKPLPARLAAVPMSAVTLRAPVPQPRRNIFCVGKNYFEHAIEFGTSGFDSSTGKAGDEIPKDPIIFTKVPESVIAHNEAIKIPYGVSETIDYEAELTVVIGKGGKGISEADAMNHVWGYTIVNDVTARDWQQRHKQWHLGKSFDTFCPMGPIAVSAATSTDECKPDECRGEDTQMKLWVNGELRQNVGTKSLIFNIPKLISVISQGITLYPGDLIATGTPVGVGLGFKPPKYLKAGDLVRIEIDGIGVLENPLA